MKTERNPRTDRVRRNSTHDCLSPQPASHPQSADLSPMGVPS